MVDGSEIRLGTEDDSPVNTNKQLLQSWFRSVATGFRPSTVGVLCACFGRQYIGTGFPACFIICQCHLFCQKATYVSRRGKTSVGFFGSFHEFCSVFIAKTPWGRTSSP